MGNKITKKIHNIEKMVTELVTTATHERSIRQQNNTEQERLIKQLEAELRKSRSIANALTGCNEALVRSTTEEQFLLQLCELIVKSGEYQMAWIGFANQDSDKTVTPAAQYGFEYGYLEQLHISWDAASERGQGPTGRAIRTLTPETAQDIATDPHFVWREEAIKRGYASSVSLPFQLQDESTIGTINIYAREPKAFTAEEIALLSGMTKDIAFGIDSIRNARKHSEVEKRHQLEYRSKIVIANLLETALKPITLDRMLETCLDLILSIPWISIMSKGSIFLYQNTRNTLVMTTQRNLSAPLLTLCQEVPLGYCLCGRAAQEKTTVFSSCLDNRHDVRFDGITEHGHYCLPIIADNALLGVLNLYVAHNHQHSPDQELFLTTVANTLAGIIQRKSSEEQITILANTDSLTGIMNRRSYLEALQHEIARSKRNLTRLAVLYLDLDRFKQVNDNLGHKYGDLLLMQTVQRIKHVLRETDLMGRIGGDEFSIVLPNSDPTGAGIVAEKIIRLLNQPFLIDGHTIRIGVSIGCSLYPEHGLTGDLLLQMADKALYTVKTNGRNAFQLFHDPNLNDLEWVEINTNT
ncbi:MAG: GGDEF domain-containing protein [Magnetococcales bacterium]|nr:GGDEF domain-containing protein [Magnetococcales bacterium]